MDGITIAEYNTAYATVAADSKAEIMAAANDEGSYWYGLTDAEISSVITCSQVDGGYVATMTRTETIVKNGYSTSDVQEAIITAKDGKIISVDISSTYTETYYKLYAGEDDEEGEEVSSDTEGAIMVTETDTYEEMITMEYAFSDTTYNGVTVSLPTDSTQIKPADDYYSKTVNIYMNGVDCGEEYIYGNTIAEALDDIYTPHGMTLTLYKDAACTQALDGTMTTDEFLAMETVYCVATPMEGYMLYTGIYEDVFAEDVPDAYKIVFYYKAETRSGLEVASINEGSIYLYGYGNCSMKVNGVEVELEDHDYYKCVDYPVTEGETYVVTKTTTHTKASLNLFEMSIK